MCRRNADDNLCNHKKYEKDNNNNLMPEWPTDIKEN